MDNFRDILLADDKAKHGTIPVVISSRIRLARNLSGYRFVKYACRDDLRKVADKCEDTLKKYFLFKDKGAFSIKSLLDYEKCALVEHHLCSQELIQDFNESRLVLSGDNMTSIMMNEEDHLRIQVFGSDLDFKAMFDEINVLDDYLCENLDIAFDEKYGFLTACPTNVGTGMRASVMVHLPALVMTKQITNIIHAVQKLGFVVRGTFGEGSEPYGNFFQISNQQTLGLSEVDILSRLIQIIRSVVEYESNAREILKKERQVWLYDNMGRALGVLRGCYSMGSIDAINCISLMIMASDMKYIPQSIKYDLNKIMMKSQSAHIQVIEAKPLKQQEIEIKRAEILRKFFATVPDIKFE